MCITVRNAMVRLVYNRHQRGRNSQLHKARKILKYAEKYRKTILLIEKRSTMSGKVLWLRKSGGNAQKIGELRRLE